MTIIIRLCSTLNAAIKHPLICINISQQLHNTMQYVKTLSIQWTV